MESRDELPDPKQLKVKIIDENSAREQRNSNNDQARLVRGGKFTRNKAALKTYDKLNLRREEPRSLKSPKFKFRCHRCRQIGHKAAECPQKSETKKRLQSEKISPF
ncbi:hypothetical protein P5V15_002704 [Pogonomyrmex californicus]